MSLPQLPHRGSEKSATQKLLAAPLGKHIQVLQHNPLESDRRIASH